MEGLDEVAALAHVSYVVRNRHPGDALDWAAGGVSNVCAVFGSVQRHSDLVAAREEIDRTITLEYDEAPPQRAASSRRTADEHEPRELQPTAHAKRARYA